jgi:hypothetical protein
MRPNEQQHVSHDSELRSTSASGPRANPTPYPTTTPTSSPTPQPAVYPTPTPTNAPTLTPTNTPTHVPTLAPTKVPTQHPTAYPSAVRLPHTRHTCPAAIPHQRPLPAPQQRRQHECLLACPQTCPRWRRQHRLRTSLRLVPPTCPPSTLRRSPLLIIAIVVLTTAGRTVQARRFVWRLTALHMNASALPDSRRCSESCRAEAQVWEGAAGRENLVAGKLRGRGRQGWGLCRS